MGALARFARAGRQHSTFATECSLACKQCTRVYVSVLESKTFQSNSHLSRQQVARVYVNVLGKKNILKQQPPAHQGHGPSLRFGNDRAH